MRQRPNAVNATPVGIQAQLLLGRAKRCYQLRFEFGLRRLEREFGARE